MGNPEPRENPLGLAGRGRDVSQIILRHSPAYKIIDRDPGQMMQVMLTYNNFSESQ